MDGNTFRLNEISEFRKKIKEDIDKHEKNIIRHTKIFSVVDKILIVFACISILSNILGVSSAAAHINEICVIILSISGAFGTAVIFICQMYCKKIRKKIEIMNKHVHYCKMMNLEFLQLLSLSLDDGGVIDVNEFSTICKLSKIYEDGQHKFLNQRIHEMEPLKVPTKKTNF
jgi:hypothetical protein